MALRFTLGAYMEALQNEIQRTPRLRDFHPISTQASRALQTTHSTTTAHLQGKGREWTLTIPHNSHFSLSNREIQQRILCNTSLSTYPYSEYIPAAVTLFDSTGKASTFDAILQERHTPLMEFIRLNCSAKHRIHLRHALEDIASLFNIRHGDLNRRRICFTPTGEVRLMDQPIVTESRGDDHIQLGQAALLIYIGASDINAFRKLVEPATSAEEEIRRLRCLLSAAEFHGNTSLAMLASTLLAESSCDTVARCTTALSHEPFAPLPILSSLLEGKATQNNILHETYPTPPFEEVLKIDFSLCDEVARASDQIVRYRRGIKWGYAYSTGERIMVNREIIAAYDFEEGRAVIRTPGGYGLINTSGRLIMNDVWEDMCWYSDENVVVAADNMGRWHIYDRMGRQLSTVACDWMGDASEGIIVAKRNGKFGYLTTDGAKRTDFIYEEAYSFSDGLARVKLGGRYYHIDTTFHRHH